MYNVEKPKWSAAAERLAAAISAVFNPMVSLVVYFAYYSVRHFSAGEALRYFLPIFLIILAPAVLWIVYMVRSDRYTNLDVSNRLQRRSLYFFLVILISVYLLWDYFFKEDFDLVLFFILMLTIALQLSNYIIKSSMHTAFNVFTTSLFFSQNVWWGIAWAFVTVLVAASRIILKRHTPAEVFSGFFIAALVSLVYLYINIQVR